MRRLLMALALGLGAFVLLSSWMGRATPHRAWGTTDEVGATLALDPRIAALMDQITISDIVAYERALTGEEAIVIAGELYTLSTRHSTSGEPISKATRYVYERFQNMSLDVTFHTYTYAGNHWRNVVAERQGLSRPDEIYLITAHLDDEPRGGIAPGADDNASGSTAVLIAADLLSQLDFGCTLRFVLFTGEEQGLRGSAAYASAIAAAGDDVRAVLNMDMIGYDSDADPIVDLHVRGNIPASMNLAETFSQVVGAYDLDLNPDILVDDWMGNYSDNKSFWDQGYPAILAIEDEDDFTPHYHTVGDTLDTLDLDYLSEFVRAGVGTLAHAGCLLNTGLLTGTVTDVETGSPLTATVTAIASAYAYTTSTGADGYYSLTLPAYTFTVHAQANLAAFQSAVVANVAILAGETTVQHLVVQPWTHLVFIPWVE